MAPLSPARPTTVAEVERLVRGVAFKDWSKPNPWGLLSIASALGGFAALLLWPSRFCGPEDLANFIALAGGGYFCSRRACMPSSGAPVDARVVEAIIRSTTLAPSFKQLCTEAYYQGSFTYQRLMYLAWAQPAR